MSIIVTPFGKTSSNLRITLPWERLDTKVAERRKEIWQEIEAAIESTSSLKGIALDISCVNFMDSSGDAMLWAYAQQLRQRGFIVCIASPTPIIRSLFEVTRIDTIFWVFDDIAEAEARLDAAPQPKHEK